MSTRKLKIAIVKILNLIKFGPKYIKADRISINKKNGDCFLIYKYEGTNGLMTQMVCVIGWIKHTIEHKYKLYVDMSSNKTLYSDGTYNSWDVFFKQPFIDNSNINTKSIIENYSYAYCPIMVRQNLVFESAYSIISKIIKPKIKFPLPRDYKNKTSLFLKWCEIYKQYIHFSDETQNYIENEYSQLIANKGTIIGVLIRGTDYTQGKPYRHPIQPSMEDIVNMIEKASESYKWDYIYLATEEEAISKKMKELYPNKIIENKRTYYDGDYTNKWLYSVIKDNKSKAIDSGLQYLSSIYILSKCDILLGGLCGGTQAALIMNDNNYRYVDLFDKGDYGVD